jgi:hypothetical protein
VRLGTCIAAEVVVGLSLAAGVAFAGVVGWFELRSQWEREASAGELPTAYAASALRSPTDADPRIKRVAVAGDYHVDPTLAPVVPMFHGQPDEVLLAPFRAGEVSRVKFNRGGSSISMRIDFANGARAAFKPEQTNPQSTPRFEVAAYRMNLLLGLNAVQPAWPRALSRRTLYNKMLSKSRYIIPRLDAEMLSEGGQVRGVLSWWIPVIGRAKVRGEQIDSDLGIWMWKNFLDVGAEIPDSEYELVRQISTMVLFDYIINNPDRWTGANARVSEDRKILYFMDNAMSFGLKYNGHRRPRIYLKRSQKFSRSLVVALRSLTQEGIDEAMNAEVGPFAYILSDREIKSVMQRRKFALEYIDGLIEEHGESAVLVFP